MVTGRAGELRSLYQVCALLDRVGIFWISSSTTTIDRFLSSLVGIHPSSFPDRASGAGRWRNGVHGGTELKYCDAANTSTAKRDATADKLRCRNFRDDQRRVGISLRSVVGSADGLGGDSSS